MNLELPRMSGTLFRLGEGRAERLNRHARLLALLWPQRRRASWILGVVQIKGAGLGRYRLRSDARLSLCIALPTTRRFPFFRLAQDAPGLTGKAFVFLARLPTGRPADFALSDAGSEPVVFAAFRPVPAPAAPPDPDAIELRLAAAAPGPVAEADYVALRAALALSDAPPLRRRQLGLLLDAAALVNHYSAWQSYRTLRSQMVDAGAQAEFSAFSARLHRQLAPRTINQHGYPPALAARPLGEVMAELAALQARLAAQGAPSFVASGSLLGLMRGGQLLPHDDDLDLGVVLPGDDAEAAARAWTALIAAAGDLLALTRRDGFVTTRLPSGIDVDLFPAWIEGGRAFAYPYLFGDLPATSLMPLASRSWGGTAIGVPADAEAVLAVNYGAQWRQPDPTWRFDWPRARQRFRPFLQRVRTA